MAAKTITVLFDPETDKISVETSGFQGEGCTAMHQAFSGSATPAEFIKKPEFKAVQLNRQTVRR